jgi:uncharacterized protein (DUF4415 family)
LLHNDTNRNNPAIFALHGGTRIFRGAAVEPPEISITMFASEGHMNKEFAQEWDAPASAGPAPAARKSNVVALKQIVTIRLDTDMLEWYKGAGPGYQTRINQILRQYMTDHRNDGGQPN